VPTAVRFSEAVEFIAELARDVDLIHRRIVRVSLRFTPSRGMPVVRHVEVVAGYEVAGGDVVRMERWVGDYWGEGFDRKALDAADELQRRIVKAAEDLGLETRPGVFERAKAAR
jgi:hypothetical protein